MYNTKWILYIWILKRVKYLIFIGYSQRTHGIPRTSYEGLIRVLTSGTYRRPSGDSQGTNTKTDDLMIKLCFRSSGPCITYLFLFFIGRRNIQKLETGTYTIRLWDPVAGRPGNQMIGRSRDIRKTSVKHVF